MGDISGQAPVNEPSRSWSGLVGMVQHKDDEDGVHNHNDAGGVDRVSDSDTDSWWESLLHSVFQFASGPKPLFESFVSGDEAGGACFPETNACSLGIAITEQMCVDATRSDAIVSTGPDLHKTESASVQDFVQESWQPAVSRLLLLESLRIHPGKSSTDIPPITNILHVRQQETWDCGIACLQMVFAWLKEDHRMETSLAPSPSLTHLQEQREELLEAVGTQSVWTVDLVVQIHHFLECAVYDRKESLDLRNSITKENADDTLGNRAPIAPATFLFCTTTLEVNEALQDYSYYEKAFDQDRVRVEKLFDFIRKENIPVLRVPTKFACSRDTGPGGLPLEHVIHLVQKENCIAIALVDNSILLRGMYGEGCEGTEALPANESYVGHYVLIVGVCREDDFLVGNDGSVKDSSIIASRFKLVICNPGIDEPVSHVEAQLFERAWRASGTDQDIIFIAKHQGD